MMKKEPQKLSVVLLKTAFYYLLYFWLLYFFAWNDGLKALSGADVTCQNPGDECGKVKMSDGMKNLKPKDDLDRELLRILLFWIIYFVALVMVYAMIKGNPAPKIWGIVLLSLYFAFNTVKLK